MSSWGDRRDPGVGSHPPPPKQRHTSRRIFERLRDEYGYTGGIAQVNDAVAASLHEWEVFVPLSHPAGEAQIDFGETTVVTAGTVQGAVEGDDLAVLGWRNPPS